MTTLILAVTLNPESILITATSKPWTITDESHCNYDEIRELAKDVANWPQIVPLLDVTEAVINFGDDNLKVEHGAILYNGRSIGTRMSDYMFRMMKEKVTIEPLIAFLDNLRLNPSRRAVNELYSFMDANELPITQDGHFLAYKFVTEDYLDCHSRSVDNSIGEKPSMPRNKVDDDKTRTCSEGYHFCSMAYLKDGWGQRWMVVKINPRDVVSIPVDYKNTKGRCSDYEVIAELDKPDNHSRHNEEQPESYFDSVVDNKYDSNTLRQKGIDDAKADCEKARRSKTSYDKQYNVRNPQSSDYTQAYNETFKLRGRDESNATATVNESTLNDRNEAGQDQGVYDRQSARMRKVNKLKCYNPDPDTSWTQAEKSAYLIGYDIGFY